MKHRPRGKHRIRLGAIFFVSILALAGIGISYAGLHDVINIFGSVQTAVVEFQDVTYEGTEIYENNERVSYLMPIDHTSNPSGVAFGSFLEVTIEYHNLTDDNDYEAQVNFTIGSIPVKINKLDSSNNDFSLSMQVTRNGEPVEVVKDSQLHSGELVTITVSVSGYEFEETEDFLINLEIIQWTGPCDDETPMPDPECQTETAWGGDTMGDGWSLEDGDGGRWWYYYNASDGGKQTIWAGRTIDVGNVTVSDPDNGQVTITIELTGGWELQDDEEAIKIQGYNESELPSSRPSMGKHDRFYAGRDFIVESPFEFDFYAIHLDVQLCPD